MRKVKISFYAQFIIVGIAFFIFEKGAKAAEIIKKFPKKYSVAVDKGKLAGYGVGMNVCFFSPSGRKVGCGVITKSRLKRSRVKVSRPLLKRIDKSYSAELDKNQVNDHLKKLPNMALRLGFSSLVQNPVAVNKLSYRTQESGNSSIPLWNQEGKLNTALSGFALDADFLKSGISFGLQFNSITEVQTKANRNQERIQAVETSTTGQVIGTHLDYFFFRSAPNTFRRIGLGIGASYSNTQINHLAFLSEDEVKGNQIFEGNANISAVNLRLSSKIDYSFDSSLIYLSSNLYVPMQLNSTVQAKSMDLDSNVDETAALEDFEESLNPHSNGFGLDFGLGIGLVF